MSIKKKIPIAIIGFSVLSIVCIMVISLFLTRQQQLEVANQEFDMMMANRENEVSRWIDTAKATLITTSRGKQTIDALYGLSAAFNDIKDDPRQVLQNAYITENPNKVGEKHLLRRGEGNELYHSEHARIHRSFAAIIEQYGLYDLFLINRNADIVYTVFKEIDFADNLRKGELASSGLATVYEKAMAGKAGDVFLSRFEPYGPSAGAYALFMATPIVSETGSNVGVLAVQLPEVGFNASGNDSVLFGNTTELYLVNHDLQALSGSNREDGFKFGEPVKELAQVTGEWSDDIVKLKNVMLQSGQYGLAQTKQLQIAEEPWLLVAERDYADILSGYYSMLKLQVGAAFACLLAIGLLGTWMARGFAGPIAALDGVIHKVADGTLDVDVPYTHMGDEVGAIAKSIDEMRSKLAAAQGAQAEREKTQAEMAEVVEQLTTSLKRLANGDLTKKIEGAFPHGYEDLRHNFNDTVQKMCDSLQQIAIASEGMRAQSGELTRASEDLAHRTEVQAATLEQTAAAMDQMTASVKSAADGIREVEGIVVEARKDADDCGVVVNVAISAMAEIEKSSDQIGQIIGVIDDIAFQTNLLALNAGVEAARAGDAGRGFAVVALEVGALAQRASSAAKEIKTLIGTSTDQVERGVTQVKQAGVALNQIVKRVTQISSLTSDIASGAAEQALGLNEINVGVTQLDQSTQKNAAMAEEASAASQMMVAGTKELSDLVARFVLPPMEGRAAAAAPEFGADRDPAAVTATAAASPDAVKVGSAQPESAPFGAEQPRRAAAGGGRGVWQDF